jgi:aminoglycoside phosphotransferase (APT) family kinase protein
MMYYRSTTGPSERMNEHHSHGPRLGTSAIDGIDEPSVSAWLATRLSVTPPLRFQLISGGRSNLTYGVSDATGRRLVLRRPPLGSVLESAHDMGREHRILAALGGTSVPVPSGLALCSDPDVNGAPFYVMDFVDGMVIRDELDADRLLTGAARAALGTTVVDVLAELHALDPTAVGLGSLGRPQGYVERQLHRWHRQWEQSRTREIPSIDAVHDRLLSAIPKQQRVSIVHGDYRIDNLVIRPDGSVAAVLDWELCTLGDPLADLGMLALYWVGPDEDRAFLLSGTPTAAPGFTDRHAVLERYAQRTGLDVGEVEYYIALALWKLACIAEGIVARSRSGAMGHGQREMADLLTDRVPLLADRAQALLR